MYGESGSLFYFMIIKSVEPHLLSCPLSEPAVYPFHGGCRTVFKRDAMVVRVVTNDAKYRTSAQPEHSCDLILVTWRIITASRQPITVDMDNLLLETLLCMMMHCGLVVHVVYH